ncbi:MAG: tol-pal system protein YbgF [Thiobacillus sp.]|nr:tol-pal system protein YbgF [Thiobacillus sp.]
MLGRPAWAANTDELARQIQALQQIAGSLDARLAKLESGTQQNQQLLGMLQEVEALKAEVAKMRGQAEVQVHQMDTLGKRQSDLYVDLDQRITDLAKSLKPASAVGSGSPEVAPAQAAPPVGSPSAGPATAAPQLDPMVESRSYETALDHFRGANYAGAIAGFRGFLKAYPDSTLASNAQYWIGYSYFALKDYKTALAHQQKLVVVYPASAKVPDALLNIASNMIALDDLAGARKVLEELVAKHPGTNAATLATRRLSALK